jgi:hypothetical protein
VVDVDESDLISKKELLEETGISYGQLYRWKRKNLIPEEWFIRKSTFTGQETFFPRGLIFPRIEKIVHMKDDFALDELAGQLTPGFADVSVLREEAEKRNIVSRIVLERYAEEASRPVFEFERLLRLYVVDRLIRTGEASLDEGGAVLATMRENPRGEEGGRYDVVLLRKMGVPIALLLPSEASLSVEPGVKLAARIPVAACIEELHLKLMGGTGR